MQNLNGSIISEVITGWFNNGHSTSFCVDWRNTGSQLKTKYGIKLHKGKTRRVYASNNGQSMRLFIMVNGERKLLVNPDYFHTAIGLHNIESLKGKDIFNCISEY